MSIPTAPTRLIFICLCALALGFLVARALRASESGTPSPGDTVVCRVNGSEIRQRDLRSELARRLPMGSFHGNVDAEKRLALQRESLQALIDAELKYQDAQRREIRVGPEDLDAALRGVIARYNDEKAFEARLEATGHTRADLLAALRRKQMIRQVEDRVGDAGRPVSDEDLRRYYDENRATLIMPAQATVRRIFIRVPPLGRSPETWRAALDRAAAARARIEAGEPFEALVAEISDASEDEKASGGLLGSVHPEQLEPDLDAVIWSIPGLGMSKPIRTFRGVHLLKVEKRTAPRQLEFDELRERLRSSVPKARSRERLSAWLAGLRAEARIEILVPALAP